MQLRAQGLSYVKIAQEVGIAKQTATDICKANEEAVNALRAYELEELYEEQRITKEERIRAHANLMRRLREEIERRPLADLSTDKLIDLYLKTASTLKDEVVEPIFQSTEEQERNRKERETLERFTSFE